MRERSETQAGTTGATRQILAGVTVAAMLTGVGLLHVASRMAAVNAGYRLGKVEEQHKLLERDNVALKLQLATLRSAAHLEATARTQLGMTTPAAQAVFQVGGAFAPVNRLPAVPAKGHKPSALHQVPGTPVALLTVEHR